MLKFDKNTNFFISYWYKNYSICRYKVYEQFENFWFNRIYKKVKTYRFRIKFIKNNITKILMIQFFSTILYIKSLQYFMFIKYKNLLTKNVKSLTYKCYLKYLSKLFKLPLTKFIVFNTNKTNTFKKNYLNIKNLTFYKIKIYSFLLATFKIFYFNNVIKLKNLMNSYFYLFKIKYQKIYKKNNVFKFYFFFYKNYVSIFNIKNLTSFLNLQIIKINQCFNNCFVDKRIIKLTHINLNLYLNLYTLIKINSISMFNLNLKKLKHFNFYYRIFAKLKNRLFVKKKKKLLNNIRLIYNIKNKLVNLLYFHYHIKNLIFEIKRYFNVIYLITLTKKLKYRIIKKHLDFF
nr:hypothetical protein [Actinocyclus sp. mgcode 4]